MERRTRRIAGIGTAALAGALGLGIVAARAAEATVPASTDASIAHEVRSLREEMKDLRITVRRLALDGVVRDLASATRALSQNVRASDELARELTILDRDLLAGVEDEGVAELRRTRDESVARLADLDADGRRLSEKKDELAARVEAEKAALARLAAQPTDGAHDR